MLSSSEFRPHVFAPLTFAQPLVFEGGIATEPAPELPDLEEITAAARAEGFRQGQAEGYEQGLRQAADEQRQAIERLLGLVSGAQEQASHFTRSLEQQVVELSLAIAARVIEREAQTDPSIVLSVVRGALDEVEQAAVVQVRVSPDDYELVAERWTRLAQAGPARGAELVADERVQAGGCIVETRLGQVDAQLETKLAQIATTFEAVQEGEPI